MAISPAKKSATKKSGTIKKTTPKKPATKKVAVKSTPAKKKATGKTPVKKVAVKKVAVKKVATKKVPVKKSASVAKKPVQVMDAGELLALTIAQGMYEKKAEKIRILDLRKIGGASSDFFVVCHATSDKQVEAIAKSVEEEVKKKLHENVIHREGYENQEWILLDYFNVVAHVFQEEKRYFYGIEQLWGDARDIPFKGK